MKIHLLTRFTVLFTLIIASSALGQRDQLFVGTRPLSMGGAFLAVADDGNAIYWNPAGLARMERIQASFMYADLFGLGIKSYYASFLSRLYFIPPLTDYLTFGVDWFGIQFGDDELDFNRNQFNFALGFLPPKNWPIARHISLGANLKYLSMNARLEGLGETATDVTGWGWDLGGLYHLDTLPLLPGRANLGFMIHDLGGTRVRHNAGFTETLLRQNVRLGLSYRPFDAWSGGKLPISDPVLAFDFDDRLHLGLEFWLANTLALRFGWQKDRFLHESATLSFGIGFKSKVKDWPEVHIDYAVVNPPTLPNTNNRFGGSIILRKDPRLLRIDEIHINDIFASLYLHYGDPAYRVGQVKLLNVYKDTLAAEIFFKANKFMDDMTAAQSQKIEIEPGQTKDIPLRAVFGEEILSVAGQERITGRVEVRYTFAEGQYKTTGHVDFRVHGKNFITWDDPAKAAAFVTVKDDRVETFARQSLQSFRDKRAHWSREFNLFRAMLLYEALRQYKVQYAKDPNTPFARVSGKMYRLDTIQYPGDFLQRPESQRSGDCDDLSVLYTSLLESSEIGTALLSIPGHLFMMFDTGIPLDHRLSLPVGDSLLVAYRETLWIPVDAYFGDSTFVSAWKAGAKLAKSWQGHKDFEIIPLESARSLYPAAIPSHAPAKQWSIPLLDDSIDLNLLALDEWKNQLIAHYRARIASNPRQPETVNKLGVLYAQLGEYTNAEAQFKRLLPDYAPAVMNLGNLYFINGDALVLQGQVAAGIQAYKHAARAYRSAQQLEPYDWRSYLNQAILYQALKEVDRDSAARKGYQKATERALEIAAGILKGHAPEQLKIATAEMEKKAGWREIKQRVKKKMKQLKEAIDRAFDKYLTQKNTKDVTLVAAGPKAGDDPDFRAQMLWWKI